MRFDDERYEQVFDDLLTTIDSVVTQAQEWSTRRLSSDPANALLRAHAHLGEAATAALSFEADHGARQNGLQDFQRAMFACGAAALWGAAHFLKRQVDDEEAAAETELAYATLNRVRSRALMEGGDRVDYSPTEWLLVAGAAAGDAASSVFDIRGPEALGLALSQADGHFAAMAALLEKRERRTMPKDHREAIEQGREAFEGLAVACFSAVAVIDYIASGYDDDR